MGQFLKQTLSRLAFLSMEKTTVTMVISHLKSISRLKIFRETEPRKDYIVSALPTGEPRCCDTQLDPQVMLISSP